MPLRTMDCRLLFAEENASEIFAICASYIPRRKEAAIEVLYPRCCGLDGHESYNKWLDGVGYDEVVTAL